MSTQRTEKIEELLLGLSGPRLDLFPVNAANALFTMVFRAFSRSFFFRIGPALLPLPSIALFRLKNKYPFKPDVELSDYSLTLPKLSLLNSPYGSSYVRFSIKGDPPYLRS